MCIRDRPLCDECPVSGACKSYPFKNPQSNTLKLSASRNINKKNIWALAILNQDGEFYLEKLSNFSQPVPNLKNLISIL
mgnify:CR=1 FL=1